MVYIYHVASCSPFFGMCVWFVICFCSPWEWTGWKFTQRMWTSARSSWTCRSGMLQIHPHSNSFLASSSCNIVHRPLKAPVDKNNPDNSFFPLNVTCSLETYSMVFLVHRTRRNISSRRCFLSSNNVCWWLQSFSLQSFVLFCARVNNHYLCCLLCYLSLYVTTAVSCHFKHALEMHIWLIVSFLLLSALSGTQRLTWTSRSTTAGLELKAYRFVHRAHLVFSSSFKQGRLFKSGQIDRQIVSSTQNKRP